MDYITARTAMSELLQYLPLLNLLIFGIFIPALRGYRSDIKSLQDVIERLSTELKLIELRRETIESKLNDHEQRLRVLERE